MIIQKVQQQHMKIVAELAKNALTKIKWTTSCWLLQWQGEQLVIGYCNGKDLTESKKADRLFKESVAFASLPCHTYWYKMVEMNRLANSTY